MKTTVLTMVTLLLLVLPLAAQGRCVENPGMDQVDIELAIEHLQKNVLHWNMRGQFTAEEIAQAEEQLRRLENKSLKSWTNRNGVGNGWFADQPNSCVLYTSTTGEPMMGTRIYQPDWAIPVLPAASWVTGPGEHQAVVINGPAHIRSGPGLDYPHHRWCRQDWSLTVWTPAQDGWLPASCYNGNGWIHESLVQVTG